MTRELRRQVRAHRHRREELAAALPGVVAAWQSAGDSLHYHPHGHFLVTDGVFLPSGEFYGYLDWDARRLTALLRDSVVASFTRLGLLSPEAAETMLGFDVERSGFHVHVETRVDPDDREHVRTLLKYLTRSPIALERLHYSDRTGQVTYRTKKGATLQYLHPIDFLADLSQHIPPRGRPILSHHGWFASALGRLERRGQPEPDEVSAAPPPRRRTPWGRLILRVWQVDPENCPRCGTLMRRSRALLERHELVRLLANLRLGGYPARPPPAPVPEAPPVTFGAVGGRRPLHLLGPGRQVPPPTPEPPSDDHNQIPPGWEDWLD